MPKEGFYIFTKNDIREGMKIGSDGIDDRDCNPNNNLREIFWPFKKDDLIPYYTGVAYAWGHVDKPARFKEKIDDTAKKYIAGARDHDYNPDSSTQGSPTDGYAGIDCSGFVQRLVMYNVANVENKWNVSEGVRGHCMPIAPKELKKGDFLVYQNKDGDYTHVVL
ncbi:MAG: NlpC/P60 family protein [Elusimicrobiota bacterium]